MRAWLLLLVVAFGSALIVGAGVLLPTVPVTAHLAAAFVVLTVPAAWALRRKRNAATMGALLAGVGLAPLVTIATWIATHPVVHVDNAGSAPIVLWIDGERSLVIAPSSESGEPAHVRVPYGTRRLAWSTLGSVELQNEIHAFVRPGMDHLYNPGKLGCYWLEATAYGQASTNGVAHGPQPLAEFYQYRAIDTWFGDNPRRVDAPRALGGKVRIAIQRNRQCMELSRLGCSVHLRSAFLRCERTLTPLSEAPDCFDEAKKACKE